MIERGVCAVSEPSQPKSDVKYTLIFMVILSFICALILSVLASALQAPQEMAKELDRSKEMLVSARILSPYGYFIVPDAEGKYGPAKMNKEGVLEPTTEIVQPSGEEILEVYRKRIQSFVVNNSGELKTFKEAGLDENKYLSEYRKTGYYRQPFKLVYKVLADPADKKESTVEGYVFPVNGMGLWDAIYGYLAVKSDGDTVIGISWYDQKETPGLGGNISDPNWQAQFPGKLIFQENPSGQTDFKTAPVGIIVVKGKVSEVLGDTPKAKSAVDGMAGATLTGNGVTDAYKAVLAPYRPFLIKIHEQFEQKK